MSIAGTLRDISEESKLNSAEKVGLKAIAKKYAELEKEIAKLKAELKSANDGVDHGNEVIEDLVKQNDKIKAENAKMKDEVAKLRRLLQDALPHIECNNESQSGLITEIGQFLEETE